MNRKVSFPSVSVDQVSHIYKAHPYLYTFYSGVSAYEFVHWYIVGSNPAHGVDVCPRPFK
jgi:hypothetical protein